MYSFAPTLLALLALSGQILSLPTSLAERQISTVQVVQKDVATANTAVRGDMASLMSAIAASGADQAQLISTIEYDLTDVASQFSTAGSSISGSTTSTATTLTASEMLALASSLTTVQGLAASMLTDYTIAKATLSKDTLAATQAEMKAAFSAIKPFSDPLVLYASKVKQEGSGFGGSAATAVQVASARMQGTVGALLASVGVGN